jgi:2-oxoisovalerate dehydrogenase E2 component (dihydrolipoyl transacylase)
MAERVFVLPDPGEGLTEAQVVTWLVAEGDTVELNQPIAEVETAKAVVEIPAPFAGVVLRLHAEAGGAIAVGQPLITFDVDGGDAPFSGGSPEPSVGSAGVTARTYDQTVERRVTAGAVASTPNVRRLAKDLGVRIEGVQGTGPAGRITAEDVRRFAERPDDHEDAFGLTVSEDLHDEIHDVGPIRRAVADNLTRQAAIPQVTTFRTVDCTALEDVRTASGMSPLPIVAAALCRTIERHPIINATWAEDRVLVHGKVNIGVATDTERGLMVPVVRDAGRRGLADMQAEIRRVAEAARSGSLGVADMVDATIGVSNTGSYGSEAGTPILTPGSAVTIAIGVVAPRALVVDGEVVARPACTLSLTFDHRVLDGAAAGGALTDLVTTLQDADRLRDLPR